MSRPRVVVLNSASVDGRIAVSRDALLLYGDKRWSWLEGSSRFDVFTWLKGVHKPGATLEGSGSFVRDDEEPQPLSAFQGDAAMLYQDFLPASVVNRPGHRGWFTAVDGRGRIRWMYKEYPDDAWKGWYALVWVCSQTPLAYLAYLQREQIPYLVAGEEHVDLARALDKMRDKLGVDCVLSTAGGRLNGALLRAGLVDEINIQLLPGIIGGFDAPALFDSPELMMEEMPAQLKLISAHVQEEGPVWLRYQVVRDNA